MTTSEFLRSLPKAQLHCHLEGSVRAATFVELAGRYGVSTVYRPDGLQEAAGSPAGRADDVYAFRDFAEFLYTFAAVCRSLKAPADYARVLREYAHDAREQGVIRAELFVSPSVWTFFHRELDPLDVFEALAVEARNIANDGGPQIAWLCDVTRNFGAERAMETARVAVRAKEFGVIGVGLGGDEANFPAPLFADVFAYARANGLHAVAHAGEAAGPQSVRDAIETLGAERIGHGIRAAGDPETLALLVEREVPLEICPTSNLRTGAVDSLDAHPLAELARSGVTVVLDTDDPAIFRTDLGAEYAIAQRLAGTDAAVRFARTSLESSFASAETKRAFLAAFDRVNAELGPSRRS
ncbi:MAG: adenosine deaminase [Candidatus Eremiobacteraeota bacterium]|nr:adenosine deaminase [Candidatus Eremiobacteraeota bacterium]